MKDKRLNRHQFILCDTERWFFFFYYFSSSNCHSFPVWQQKDLFCLFFWQRGYVTPFPLSLRFVIPYCLFLILTRLSDSRTERIIKQVLVLWLPSVHVDLLETGNGVWVRGNGKKKQKKTGSLTLQAFVSSHFHIKVSLKIQGEC